MNLEDLNPPFIELPEHQVWHRIQRAKALSSSVRTRGFILAPAGTLSGRFDLAEEVTAYLADSELTALYESLFRREARSCHLDRLAERTLAAFTTKARLRLVDLRGLEERYPVLQSLRYESTQAFAASCRRANAHGILYSSAQHSHHGCVCLFEEGIARMARTTSVALVQVGTGRLHRSVVMAAHGSQLPIIQQ
jgi:hypothetical protein